MIDQYLKTFQRAGGRPPKIPQIYRFRYPQTNDVLADNLRTLR